MEISTYPTDQPCHKFIAFMFCTIMMLQWTNFSCLISYKNNLFHQNSDYKLAAGALNPYPANVENIVSSQ